MCLDGPQLVSAKLIYFNFANTNEKWQSDGSRWSPIQNPETIASGGIPAFHISDQNIHFRLYYLWYMPLKLQNCMFIVMFFSSFFLYMYVNLIDSLPFANMCTWHALYYYMFTWTACVVLSNFEKLLCMNLMPIKTYQTHFKSYSTFLKI